MTEAFLAVVQASYAKSVVMRFNEELRSQLAVSKLPEVVTVCKCIRNGQKHGLLSAVACQGKCGNTGNINGASAAQHGIQNVVLRTKYTAGLQVNLNLAAGHLLNGLLKLRIGLSNNGIQRVNLCHNQGNLRHVAGISCRFGLSLLGSIPLCLCGLCRCLCCCGSCCGCCIRAL